MRRCFFTRHFSEPLRTSIPVSAHKANLSWGSIVLFCSFLPGVLSLYVVCVFKAGPWTDNYARVPESFTGLARESRASFNLQSEGGHSFPLVSPHSWALKRTAIINHYLESLVPLFVFVFLQHSVQQHCLTVFVTIASSLDRIILCLFFGMFLLFCFYFFEPEKPKMMYLKQKEQYWFGVKVMWDPVWTCWLWWGVGVGLGEKVGAWGPTTLLLGCASKSKLNLFVRSSAFSCIFFSFFF